MLRESALYVTLEPCPMCGGAMLQVTPYRSPQTPNLQVYTVPQLFVLEAQTTREATDEDLVGCGQARVGTLVYGAPNNLLGANGSWVCPRSFLGLPCNGTRLLFFRVLCALRAFDCRSTSPAAHILQTASVPLDLCRCNCSTLET